MYTKVLVGFIALFVLNGVLAQYSGFEKDKLLEEEEKDYYDAPHYSYHYNVHDGKTGDVKTQGESREGDVVKGFYTLIEADGTTREVHYTADKHNGFNAVVKKTGTPVAHQPQYSKPKYQGYF